MPEVTAYPVNRLGGLCCVCKRPVPAALPDDVHATCEPGWADLVAESKRAARRTTPPKEAR